MDLYKYENIFQNLKRANFHRSGRDLSDDTIRNLKFPIRSNVMVNKLTKIVKISTMLECA